MRSGLFVLVMALLCGAASAASISDLTTWTLVQDPAHPGMTASPVSSLGAALNANGPVPSGTDIGYASVNGANVAGSSAGYYFEPAEDFEIAVEFDFSGELSRGTGGLGIGIGEDVDGTDSAGVGLVFINGDAASFATAGRVDDVNQPSEAFGGAFTNGRFFLRYESATGNVSVGVTRLGSFPSPDVFRTLTGIQKQWDDEPLLVSFFLRSQTLGPIRGLSSGQVNAIFSNFRVLNGTPLTIPEPTTTVLATLALFAPWRFPRRR